MAQQSLPEYAVPTSPASVSRTVKLPLETSPKKNERLLPFIEEYQAMCRYAATMMASFQPSQWKHRSTALDQLLQEEFDDLTNKASTRQQAGNDVGTAFNVWKANGRRGGPPGSSDGWTEPSYLALRNDEFEIVENDRGYGLKAMIEPRGEPFWWHIRTHEFHEEIIADILAGDSDLSQGSCEFHLPGGIEGPLTAHLTYSMEIPRYKPDSVPRVIGIDRGVSVLYAAAAVYTGGEDKTGTGREAGTICNDGEAHPVDIFDGDEFRHHRERLANRRDEFQAAGALDRVLEMGDLRERYTRTTLHQASSQVIEFAREHAPCAIVFEDLTGYRQSAEEPIHDWPYAALEEKIRYKAHDKRIPILDDVESANTSTDCYRCGAPGERPYRGNFSRFYCYECDKEIHADVNAAYNVAQRGVDAIAGD